jgi:hypothetical protein
LLIDATRAESVTRIKDQRSLESLLVLERDRNLAVILAVWSAVSFPGAELPPRVPAGDGGTAVWIATAWDGVPRPYANVGALVGRHLPVQDLVDRAISLGLAYPDGTIHPVAESWIAAQAHRIATQMTPKQNATKRG